MELTTENILLISGCILAIYVFCNINNTSANQMKRKKNKTIKSELAKYDKKVDNLKKKITLEDYNNRIDDIEILTQEIELSSDNLDEFVDIILDTYKPKIEGGQLDKNKLWSDNTNHKLKEAENNFQILKLANFSIFQS